MHCARGWAFVARHIARERCCIVASPSNSESIVNNIIKSLQILGLIDQVLSVEDTYDIDRWQPPAKPCIVFQPTFDNVVWRNWLPMYRNWCRALEHTSSPCIVICVTSHITQVSSTILNTMPCILWDLSYFVDVPRIAERCNMINTFMTQERRALLKHGPILCVESNNMCCPLDIDMNTMICEALLRQLVVKAQLRFRARRLCATVIQQAVKQWLYRPQSSLGKNIVERLTVSCQVK